MTEQRLNAYWEELAGEECLRLLATQEYGRLGLVIAGRPEIFPVNYALDAVGAVIFRTAPGMKLASAVNHPVVFEVDRVDSQMHSGWSVILHGVALHTAFVSAGDRPLAPWVADRPYLLRVSLQSLTGRYVGRRPYELS